MASDRKDIFRQAVIRALEKDGWRITDDPLNVRWPRTDLPLHPEGERLIGAEKDTERIAIAVTSFLGPSQMVDLYSALGEFMLYQYALRGNEPPRRLFLAIRDDVYASIFQSPEGEELRAKEKIRILVFDPLDEEVVRWL
ncbi:MAG: hypothetical protein HONDAALG_02895 [Gammaproteobacteria bacterium]|nr:hypothetical protein [Gammaproteobacteria bacterium]